METTTPIIIGNPNNFIQVEASDNGYDGVGGIQTASSSIQVAVLAMNDAPVVVGPPTTTVVPGEAAALPGFVVMDPDTDTDGKLSEGMQKVWELLIRSVLGSAKRDYRPSWVCLAPSASVPNSRTRDRYESKIVELLTPAF